MQMQIVIREHLQVFKDGGDGLHTFENLRSAMCVWSYEVEATSSLEACRRPLDGGSCVRRLLIDHDPGILVQLLIDCISD